MIGKNNCLINSFYEGQSIILSTDDAYFNRMTKEMKRFTMPFYNKELVIEKIIKDKPYNFAKAFVRETGVKVPFDIKLNERYVQQYAKGGEMAEGGEVSEWKKAVTIKRATKQEAEKNKNLLKEHYGKAGRNFKVEKRDNGWVVTYEFSMTDKMAKGGVAGYERLVKKVAKNYEGKNVPRKYQSEYGKTYNKEEAKEVGYKVATKVYGMPLAKMKK